MKRGALIVLEGCDRAGKSTQLKKIAEGLMKENISNEIIAFPSKTQVSHDSVLYQIFFALIFLSLSSFFAPIRSKYNNR